MPLIETPKEFLTEKIWKTDFRGIFVGGCIERKEGSSFRRKAHAHISKEDPYFGYICVRSAKRLYKKDGRPSRLLIHEIAHFFTPKEYHSKRFHKKRAVKTIIVNKKEYNQGDKVKVGKEAKMKVKTNKDIYAIVNSIKPVYFDTRGMFIKFELIVDSRWVKNLEEEINKMKQKFVEKASQYNLEYKMSDVRDLKFPPETENQEPIYQKRISVAILKPKYKK